MVAAFNLHLPIIKSVPFTINVVFSIKSKMAVMAAVAVW
jgi:hypothetical protein